MPVPEAVEVEITGLETNIVSFTEEEDTFSESGKIDTTGGIEEVEGKVGTASITPGVDVEQDGI
jgi:hypothetical protein